MIENFSNDFVLGDEGNDTEGAAAVTFQGIGLIHPPNELSPTFSQCGALFRREVGFVLRCGGAIGAKGVKQEACFFPVNPCSGRVGHEIPHPVCSRLGDLGEDSRNKLKCVESLTLRMGEQRVVVGAFALVEQCFGTGCPMNA